MNRQVEVLLGIISVDLYQPGKVQVLCQEVDGQLTLPTRPLTSFTPEATAADLLQYATCIDPSWLTLKLICVDDYPFKDTIVLVYGCMVPESIELPNPIFKWMDMLELQRHNTNLPTNHVFLLSKVATHV